MPRYINNTLRKSAAIAAIFLIYVISLLSCTAKGKNSGQKKGHAQEIEKGIALLRQGDLVLRRGRDIASYMISQANVQDKSYSHCGLVQVENGYPFVYHSIDGQGKGRFGLRRDSAQAFFSAATNSTVAIMRYPLTVEQLQEQSEQIRYYYGKKAGFDRDFEMQTSEQLYCTEFVYLVMNKVAKDSGLIKIATKNGFEYVPVDNLYAGGIANDIWRITFK